MKHLVKIIITIALINSHIFSADVTQAEVGDNYMFWVLGQGFFSGYYQSSATLNAEGENAVVFTEDALVRDLAFLPYNDSVLVATTNSGVFISTDRGDTWVASHGTTGTSALPEQPANNLTNIEEIPYQHKEAVNSIAFEDEETWWVGLKGTDDTKTIYRTTNAGETWKKKSTGAPTFDGHNPTVNKMYFAPGIDKPYAATVGGLFYKSGSRFKNIGHALPDPSTTDWPSIPTYDVMAQGEKLYFATDYGMFFGSVELSAIDALPIGNGTVDINSSGLTYVVDEVLDSTQTDQFTWDWATGDTVWVYDYFTRLDTVSWHLGLDVEALDHAGQYVNVEDTTTSTKWKSKINPSGVVELMNDYIYQEGSLDPDLLDYADYDASNLIVHLVGTEPIYDFDIDSAGNIYYSTGTEVKVLGGESIEGLSGTINDIELSVNEDALFTATSNGLQKHVFGESGWTEITPKIGMLNKNDEISFVVTSIVQFNQDTLFVSCGNNQFDDPRTVTYRTGGVLASYDGGSTWAPKNIGLTHRSSTPDDVQSILRANVVPLPVDSTTVADENVGIYDYVTSYYGQTPNIDNNEKVNILIADMDDNAYNATSDLIIQGYFSPPDQDPTELNSNALDLIYLDSDPQDPGEAQEGIARALARLICHNYDADEEEWVLTGLEHFAAYITGHKSMPDDSFVLSNNNSLTKYGDYGNNTEYDQLFLMMEYLYEKYFNESPFEENSGKLMSVIVQEEENSVDGIENALGTINAGKSFSEVYSDWALAIHFDNPDNSLYDGLYGFENVDVSIAPSSYPWGVTSGYSPYSETIKNWSVKYTQTEKWVDNNGSWTNKALDFNQETLVVNASDNGDFDMFLIKQHHKTEKDSTATVTLLDLNLDQNRIVYSDWDDFGSTVESVTDSSEINEYQYFALIVVSKETGSDAGGSFVVDDETDPPVTFDLHINQNSDLVNYLDIYAFSDVAIYGDGASSTNSELEGPLVEINNGEGIVTSFIVPQVYDAGNGFVYSAPFDLRSFLPTTISEYWFIGHAESIGGNAAASDSVFVVAIKNDNQSAREFVSTHTQLTMTIPAQTIVENELLTVIKTDQDMANQTFMPVSDAFAVGNVNVELRRPITVGFDLSSMNLSIDDKRKLDICYELDGEPIALNTQIDLINDIVTAQIDKCGNIQLVINSNKPIVEEVPNSYKLFQNHPNPFNPRTIIQYDIPEATNVSLSVYDLLGRNIKTLINEHQKAGHYSVQWAGLDYAGNKVSSGIYFYRLETEQFSKTYKMIMVK